MQWKNSQKSYGITAIILHWSSALLVIFILGLGIYMTDLPDGDLILIPVMGYIDSSAGGYHISFFELFDIPKLIDKNEELMEFAKEIHEYLAFFLIGLLVLHIGAALKHHFIFKDNILIRMLPFTKKN